MARRTRTKALSPPKGPVTLTLPYRYVPRSYQDGIYEAVTEKGCQRAVIVWPRRHGKDLTCLAVTQRKMVERPGLYWHIYPTKVRGRLAMWDGQDEAGVPFLTRWPRALIADNPNGPGGKAINDVEMKIDFKPLPGQPAGSSWQVMGGDNPDNLAGPNPVGVIFSEYQDHDPRCWTKIIQPILANNGGFAVFDFTPQGENHAYDLFRMAQRNPKWFCQILTVADTVRDAPGEDGSAVTPERDDPAHPDRESVEEMRRTGTPEEDIQSQQYCSFKGSTRGSIFGDLVTAAETDKRVEFVPYEVTLPVGTAWDIGRDTTAIWFYQDVGMARNLIDYHEEAGKDLAYFVHLLTERKLYRYGEHCFPHDMAVTEWTATESRLQQAEKALRAPCIVAPKMSVEDSIDATRRLFRRLRFDAVKCVDGLTALRSYKFQWDEKKSCFSREPVHDWASHGGSALRTMGVTYQPGRMSWQDDDATLQRHARMDSDPVASFRGMHRYAQGGLRAAHR